MLLRGDPRPTYAGENLRETSVKTEIASTARSYRKMVFGWEIRRGRLHLSKEKEEIRTQEQNVNGYQSPSRKPSLQPRKQVDRGSKHDQSLYRGDDPSVMIIIPI